MAEFKSYIERSKLNIGNSDENITVQQVQLGCMQRIADATEKMASNYQKMEADLEMYKRWYNQKNERIKKLNYEIRTLKGHITRLKKKQKQ